MQPIESIDLPEAAILDRLGKVIRIQTISYDDAWEIDYEGRFAPLPSLRSVTAPAVPRDALPKSRVGREFVRKTGVVSCAGTPSAQFRFRRNSCAFFVRVQSRDGRQRGPGISAQTNEKRESRDLDLKLLRPFQTSSLGGSDLVAEDSWN